MPALQLPRLYPILDLDAVAARGLSALDLLDIWLAHGIRFWQLRAKTTASGPLLELLAAAVARTPQVDGRLIVNDRVDLALLSGADGVHLGQTDLTPSAVGPLVPASFLVGRSTHTDAQVARACQEPIAYLAIGPVFATATKRGAPDPAVGLEGVRAAVARASAVGLPVVAIGGITLGRAPAVLDAGADAVAVISDLLDGEPAQRVRQFTQALAAGPQL